MSKYVITGGASIQGELEVMGAKNMALKVIPAALLSKEPSEISNVPDIEDVKRMFEILESIGVSIEKKENKVIIDSKNVDPSQMDQVLVKKIRASVMLIAPFLVRFGEIYLPHPGGCTIGKRPIDIFISGFESFGVKITEDGNGYLFQAKELKGTDFFFPLISVTATESMIMAGVLAKGHTRLENCASEPEIKALADYLNKCGAKITGAGTHTIEIEGVTELNGASCEIIPDRIEAGSFAILGAVCNTNLKISQCNPDHLKALWVLFDKIGVNYELGDSWIKISPSKEPLKACQVKTHEYPGFVTDLQAPMTVLLTQSQGLSMVHETIFPGRLFYTDMLNQMGANIILCDPHRVIVNGKMDLVGRKVVSPDLRAGIAMVIAGLIAKGKTEIGNCYQIERGYSDIVNRLQKIGANIKKSE